MKPPTNHVAPPEDEIETIVLHKVGVAKEWVFVRTYICKYIHVLSPALYVHTVCLSVCLQTLHASVFTYVRVYFCHVVTCDMLRTYTHFKHLSLCV